jgi:hypothetical protein
MAGMMDGHETRLTGQVSKITNAVARPAEDGSPGSGSYAARNLSQAYGVNFTVITSPSATT